MTLPDYVAAINVNRLVLFQHDIERIPLHHYRKPFDPWILNEESATTNPVVSSRVIQTFTTLLHLMCAASLNILHFILIKIF